MLSDILPAGLTYQSVVHSSGAPPDVLTPGGNGFTANWISFPTGTSSTFTLVGTLGAVASGQVLTNTANVAFTSLPTDVFSTQSTYNTLAVERTGNIAHVGGAENDYRASDPATVTGNPAVPTKTICRRSRRRPRGTTSRSASAFSTEVVVQVPEGVNTASRWSTRSIRGSRSTASTA